MCRRFATTFPEVRPRYNISPSQTIPVIRGSADGATSWSRVEGAQDPLQHLQR